MVLTHVSPKLPVPSLPWPQHCHSRQPEQPVCLQSSECPTKCKWSKTILVDWDDLPWLLHRALHFLTYCTALLSAFLLNCVFKFQRSQLLWVTDNSTFNQIINGFLNQHLWSLGIFKNFMSSWNALLLFNADTYQTGVNRLKLHSRQQLIWDYIKRRIFPSLQLMLMLKRPFG